MNIEAFLLCDAATDQQGKLNVLGAFDNIFSKQVPAKHPTCSVATRIRFDKDGNHAIRIIIIDKVGKEIGPKLDGNISVKIPQDAGSSATNLILNIQGLEIKEYGTYWINLAINGKQKAELPFYVRPVPQKQ